METKTKQRIILGVVALVVVGAIAVPIVISNGNNSSDNRISNVQTSDNESKTSYYNYAQNWYPVDFEVISITNTKCKDYFKIEEDSISLSARYFSYDGTWSAKVSGKIESIFERDIPYTILVYASIYDCDKVKQDDFFDSIGGLKSGYQCNFSMSFSDLTDIPRYVTIDKIDMIIA